MTNKELYLDNAATTRVRKEVAAETERYMLEEYGNPSSVHDLGEKARKAMDEARIKVAKEINCKQEDIYFTSGATESNNLAVLGLAKANKNKKTIIISEIEHPSIAEPCGMLKKYGYKIIRIPVDKSGLVRLDILEQELKKNRDILVVSVMHVNNIIGTIQSIEEIGRLCWKYGPLFHTDAVQSFGKLNIDVRKMNISLLSASGHKINGPKGIGFLYVKEGIKIEPLVYGGGQEKNLRSGTENVPGIIGMAKALELIKKIDKNKIKRARDNLIEALEEIGGKINGSKNNRIYNNINVYLPINAENIVGYLSSKKIYISSGSACESKKEKEDATLKAIGLTKKEQEGSIRITLGEEITEKDAAAVIKEIKNALEKLRI